MLPTLYRQSEGYKCRRVHSVEKSEKKWGKWKKVGESGKRWGEISSQMLSCYHMESVLSGLEMASSAPRYIYRVYIEMASSAPQGGYLKPRVLLTTSKYGRLVLSIGVT